jgi:hypothetical protein
MSPQFWLGLQMDYDLDVTEETLAARLEREVKPHAILLEAADQRIKQTGGIKHDEFWQAVEKVDLAKEDET